MRLFSRSPLKQILEIETNPAAQIALVGAVLIFAATLFLTSVLETHDQQPISAFDGVLCTLFPKDICPHLARLTKDEKRAFFLTKACEVGSAFSCANLGVMYAKGRGVARDHVKAATLSQRACDGGEASGCSNLGAMYAEGRGVAQDAVKAVTIFRRACDDGNAHGCASLGFMYQEGREVAQDTVKAVAFYQQACEIGSASSCAGLGFMYQEGRGVIQDDVKAVALYQRATRIGLVDANSLGNFAKILFVQGKKTEAEQLLLRAEASSVISETLALELAFYRYAHISSTFDMLEPIYTHLSKNVRSHGWNLAPNVRKAIQGGHPEPELLAAIARVISDQENIATLSKFSLWRRMIKVKLTM